MFDDAPADDPPLLAQVWSYCNAFVTEKKKSLSVLMEAASENFVTQRVANLYEEDFKRSYIVFDDERDDIIRESFSFYGHKHGALYDFKEMKVIVTGFPDVFIKRPIDNKDLTRLYDYHGLILSANGAAMLIG